MSRRLLLRLLASAPATDHVADAELLRRFVASNDSAAFELIVRRHAGAVWAAVARVLRNEADAQDAFQATFLALVRKAKSIRQSCVGGWLHRVAVNAALKVRERAARSVPVGPNQVDALPAATTESPDLELAITVNEELARLSERERLPVVLCDLEGLSHADAARVLGWPVGTVSGRLSRARAKLRARLARRGVAPPAALLPALAAPPHLTPLALALTSGAVPPAVASITEGALTMNATQPWAWVLAAACAAAVGAGTLFALGGSGAPAQPTGAPVPVAAQNPDPKGTFTDDEWLPKIEQTETGPKPLAVTGLEKVPTAFPRLAPPERNPKDPKGWEKYQADLTKLVPRTLGGRALKIEASDDDLRRVLKARLHRGVIEWVRVRADIARGAWNANQLSEALECLTDMQAAATELWAGKPNELIPWLEELVIVAKDMEQFIGIRVANGSDAPRRLDAVVRHRLRVEAALLKAKKLA